MGVVAKDSNERLYLAQRTEVHVLVDDLESEKSILRQLTNRYHSQTANGAIDAAELPRHTMILPQEQKVANIKVRIAQLNRAIAKYEIERDTEQEKQRTAVLEDELRRRSERVREAEFAYRRAVQDYRELREQIETANA